MQNKTLLEIQKEVNEILKAKESEIAELNSKIKLTQKGIEEANEKYLLANMKLDEKAISKASQEKRDLKDILEMYENHLNESKRKPLITNEQFNNYISVIMNELDKLNGNSAQKLLKIIDQVENIAAETTNEINEANKLMEIIQNNLYKDTSYFKVMKNGNKVVINNLVKRYDNYDIIHWSERLVNKIKLEELAKKGV